MDVWLLDRLLLSLSRALSLSVVCHVRGLSHCIIAIVVGISPDRLSSCMCVAIRFRAQSGF